ncbi:DUF4440 domain-containing protein [Bacterioplanes sanyensis]|uniref:DUF4440 domain-containing protein n=1 Tax=Bacterioplanes sanyensis TaxID=1249553 RepID=A0A222FGL6_9GAMM|nr:nuclear transport factor 2 family protein [Bacterioplanes sanyensis]ASP37624.1 DUF4440 domain-containing protein [Bacterioplanes sanyensis]
MNSSFEHALAHHLDTIRRKDIKAFCDTLIQDERLTLILPNGTLMQGYDAIAEFHQHWFADPDWSMTLEQLSTTQTAEMANALFSVVYDDLDPDGKPYRLRYFLSLTFVLEDEQWRLLLDQNTMLPDHSG